MISFVREAFGELTKVTFPSRDEVVKLTVLVIAISIIVGAYLGALDYLFTEALAYVIG